MTNIKETVTNRFDNLREFSPELPNAETIDKIAEQTAENRRIVVEKAEAWGFDPEFIAKQGPVLVGPFFSPGSIPTSFGGDPRRFSQAMEVGACITESIGGRLPSVQASLVTLDFTDMPRKGPEQMDVILCPNDNGKMNERVRLANPNYKQPYSTIGTDQNIIGMTMWEIWRSRATAGKLRGCSKEEAVKITEEILLDMPMIGGTGSYTEYMRSWNLAIQQRTTSRSLPIISVDTNYYQPLITRGIADFPRFINTLNDVGYFANGPAKLFKAIDPTSQLVRGVEWDPENELLRFEDQYDQCMDFETVRARFPLIAPVKALSYIWCFGQVVPVVYGCDNRGNPGDIYEPYAIAKKQVEAMGLKPVMYRTQARISYDINAQGTLFDYYWQLKQ